ncbi:alpha/beta hydrolase [Shimia sp. SDUM112013]|uniref:alpha/beta fold hydrolase n=1 Tax=Shimia sp. SDUM112013 TaxID=3136160 RepID=UPI0032ED2027
MGLDTVAPLHLHARSFGHGPEPALALHCSLAHSGAWRGVAGALAEDMTVTALDLPSHGRSPDWDGQGDITDATVAAVRPFLGRPMHLIGHSYGGVIALRLAVQYPHLVKSVSLFEPVLMAVAREDGPEQAAWNAALMQTVMTEIAAGHPDRAARAFMRVWGDGRRWDDLPEDLRAGATRRITVIRDSEPSLGHDNWGLIPRLGEIQAPLVLMDGAESPALMKVVQDGIAARVHGARRKTFEGLAHMGPITHPKTVAAEILQNVRRAEG